ncbi:T cell immune regulator 1, ATPase H+ transporting V0 subunit a3b [Polypterus senegalus]|uniref:T cell immune regulator 1, ATPase H+ transporting V0 subunit a3b n=1 Tax=Polypterus senegalus TaxID=55291 RepID=UPI001962BA3F|nr:T cell immune regulator 1, ATPase H+ transporting V0 subunit a3b [Polypterus senegalus]
MGSIFRSEEVCLTQLFLQSASAYGCVSELGEIGLVEFRDLNPNVNAFQRRFVADVRRCEELEKTFVFLENEVKRAGLELPLLLLDRPTEVSAPAPSIREANRIQEDSEKLAQEIREVTKNRDSLRSQLREMNEYRSMLIETERFTSLGVPSSPHLASRSSQVLDLSQSLPPTLDARLSFTAGVIHPWKANAFERLLWRACRGYMIVNFVEMPEPMEDPATGELVNWVAFLISYWGDQIGQKVKKICDCYHTHIYVYPDSQSERREIIQGLETRIQEIQLILTQTETFLHQVLLKAIENLPTWIVQIKKSKAIYLVLNMCSFDVTEKCLIAEVWCPVQDLPLLRQALSDGSRKSGTDVESFFNRIPANDTPPTLFRTNKFTSGFQSIVDAYGVASYQEVNPAPYTIITFPFLFAVMFGDVGHGIIMFLFGLWMVINEKDPKMKNSNNEIWQTFFGGRYLILLMGAFSVYTGAIYNECFSVAMTTFPSGWSVKAMFDNGIWRMEDLASNTFLSLDPNKTGVFQNVYPFGIDPVWSMSNNHLNFLNSYKMKMSVIIGIIHMTFGVCLSVFNYRHFKKLYSIILVFIPEVIFMLGLFGYLVFLIIFKWIVYGPLTSNVAPSILLHFIDMFMFTENQSNEDLYEGQQIVQMVVLIVAVCGVPVLLFGKPFYLLYQHYCRPSRQSAKREDLQRLLTEEPEGSVNTAEGDVEKGESHKDSEFDFTDIFMHQAIHTIEYCLGCISNTASYLRLWALSLAHAQLSEVLWAMVMSKGLRWADYYGSAFLFLSFAAFAVLTIGILLVMEGLSAFLHALRLHWVEFQNKFYTGAGYKLNPFSFKAVLESLVSPA